MAQGDWPSGRREGEGETEGEAQARPPFPLAPPTALDPTRTNHAQTGRSGADEMPGAQAEKSAPADPPLGPGLPTLPLWLAIVYCLVSLGLYSWVWLGRRMEGFNALDSESRMDWRLYWAALVFLVVSMTYAGMDGLTPDNTFKALDTGFQVASALVYLFLLFCARGALEDHTQAAGCPVRINRLLLLLFGLVYLQYKINVINCQGLLARPAGGASSDIANPAVCG